MGIDAAITQKLCGLSTQIKLELNPFLHKYGVTYTHHTRVFNDGRSYLLTNNPAYLQHFLKSNYALPERKIYLRDGIFLWSGIKGLQTYDNQVSDLKNYFNVDHQLAVVYAKPDYADIFALGTTPDKPEIVNSCLNNLDLFHAFFAEYQDKFRDDLRNLDQQQLNIPLRPKNFITTLENRPFGTLSKRELECIQLMSLGKTAKMIANDLTISVRTVERHIGNIKDKLGLKYKVEVISKYLSYINSSQR